MYNNISRSIQKCDCFYLLTNNRLEDLEVVPDVVEVVVHQKRYDDHSGQNSKEIFQSRRVADYLRELREQQECNVCHQEGIQRAHDNGRQDIGWFVYVCHGHRQENHHKLHHEEKHRQPGRDNIGHVEGEIHPEQLKPIVPIRSVEIFFCEAWSLLHLLAQSGNLIGTDSEGRPHGIIPVMKSRSVCSLRSIDQRQQRIREGAHE